MTRANSGRLLKKAAFFFGASLVLALSGCQQAGLSMDEKTGAYTYDIVGPAVAADFGPDGRLWRLIPTADYVYVDYSTDNGKTYSSPVKVNQIPRKIDVWPENPPAISVGRSGRVHVIYYADEEQKATTFYSYSDDQGRTFSEPVLISDHAQTARNYMDKMLVDEKGKVYLFWHDTRHGDHDHHLGSGVLSLYYTTSGENEDDGFVNRKLADSVCSCCRTATDLDAEGRPVILARMVFQNGIRDHALIRMDESGNWSTPRRIIHDQWQVDACPEHGPALAVGKDGRSHLAWFTLGENRKGIFYANSDDFGRTLSPPMALGNPERLPSHPAVFALGNRVVLAWKEFNGYDSSIVVKESNDRGKTWSPDRLLMETGEESGYPDLIGNGKSIYLSWAIQDKGHQIIEITP
ncbi:MAG: exo-alpha-sialidase [Gammaproteobacteria bacterium]